MDKFIADVRRDIEDVQEEIIATEKTVDRYKRSVDHLKKTLESHQSSLLFLQDVEDDYASWKSKEVTLGFLHGDAGGIFVTSPDVVTVGDFSKYPKMELVRALRLSKGGTSHYVHNNRFITVFHPPKRSTKRYKVGVPTEATLWVREWVVMSDTNEPRRRGYHGCHSPNNILRIIELSNESDNFFYTGWRQTTCVVKKRSGNNPLVAKNNDCDDYNIVLIDY